MSNNENNSELKDIEIIENIKRIKELYEGEIFLEEKILKTKVNKNLNFVLFDKEWLKKWKSFVGYENLKDKCKNSEKNGKISQESIDEVRSLFIENNTKKKLNDLGNMDCSKLQRKSGNKVFILENSNFVPIVSTYCAYFEKLIKNRISVNSQISNGVIYIHDQFPENNKEKKLILLYKESENNPEFIRPVITIAPNEKIPDVVKKLKSKKIEEILNQKEYKIEIVKSNEAIDKIEEEKQRIEEEKKKKEEEEKKRKEAEAEAERKNKEEEKKRKEAEAEAERKKKEEEEKKRKEEEAEAERKKKEEEEKKRKEEEAEAERKKKEEEEKRLQKEIEERKKQQKIDIKKEKKENDKITKERNREVNKTYIDNLENILCDAVKTQIIFEEKIRQKGDKKDENFIFPCKVIKKEYLNNFEKILNYDSIKEQINKNPNDANQIFKNAINNNTIKINELQKLVPIKPEDLIPQALVDIEKLAFVDDEFASKIIQFCHNSNLNMNNQNNSINQINNQNSPLPQLPKANIIFNNGAGAVQTQENMNQVFTMNFKDNNINKPENIQVFNFPKNANFNICEQIPKKSGDGLIQEIQKNYISSNPKKHIEPPKPITPPNPIIPKVRKTLDGRDVSLGLDNVGATCYMNATLQCLAHLKRITEHIINYRENGTIKDVKKYRLCEAYSEVVCEIWKKDSDKKSFAPERFKKVLGEMNSLFAPTAANDAKDLLIYFIEQMHTELNVSPETNLNLIMPDDMNPMDHQQVLKCFIEEFMKKYNSVFSHYCYGSNVSVTNCNGCGVQKFSYQCFSFIIFPLLEAKKNCVLEGRLNPMFYNNYTLNIEDCFKYNQKIEFFNGSNQMYCNVCQGSRDSWMQTRISSPPLVLILILNRGKGNLDFREPFIFWETIDLRGYVEFPLSDNKYFLSGVVSHMGDSGPSGHFIAYCRMSENQKWYCYNDSFVTESNFQEINSRGFPYILFYQKSQM